MFWQLMFNDPYLRIYLYNKEGDVEAAHVRASGPESDVSIPQKHRRKFGSAKRHFLNSRSVTGFHLSLTQKNIPAYPCSKLSHTHLGSSKGSLHNQSLGIL